jgi:CRP-like cAMP-binding protein
MDAVNRGEYAEILTEEERKELEAIGQLLRRGPGHVFIEEGEWTDFVLLIVAGHVAISSGDRIVAIRRAGEIVGEAAPILAVPRSATVKAMDNVEVLRISSSGWKRFLEDHPRAMFAQLAVAYTRIEQATRKFAESELAVEQKLAKALVELAETPDLGVAGAEGLTVDVSQQVLAAMAGASLEAIKKAVRSLKQAGLIGTARRRIVVHDLEVVRSIADGDSTAAAMSDSSSPQVK